MCKIVYEVMPGGLACGHHQQVCRYEREIIGEPSAPGQRPILRVRCEVCGAGDYLFARELTNGPQDDRN